MKILSIIGARPQFIKAAIVSSALIEQGIDEVLVNTGQHYDYNMSGQFLDNLNMKLPDYNLNVGSGTHGKMTAAVLVGCENIILKENPDYVIVYGDTNSTLAGALAAAKLKVPVAHIEAGIRMHPKTMPEEINRVIVDRISTKLFCPTKLSIDNLKLENIKEGVILAGDVMYDIFIKMQKEFDFEIKKQIKIKDKYILATLHRDYNVDDPAKLEKIFIQLNEIANSYSVVFPLHPRTMKMIKQYSLEKYLDKLVITEPLSYSSLMGLLLDCEFIITDSGGLQKESYFAEKRAIVVMPDTGWQELIDNNINLLADENNICDKVNGILTPATFTKYIYGKGNAAQIIASALKNA
ncbi:MAG: UDP-N-acetylglucosamine 2-epimerase (non-hydrolyzing) [Bacteroidales bacterium]|nr:UDP-N-acetylglucosamine 2-epimerase (non-hydrolyzing) [Bacteroidales bacterium]